jgi:hypothetical protein
VKAQDRIDFIEKYLLIVDKAREVTPFKLNKVQRYYMENKSRRTLILKARQLGLSSVILADMFVESITVPNSTCVVISHEQHATERLLSKIHFYYETLQTPVKPEMGHKSASEITFPELNSSIYIGTARSMTFGRGDTINKCHLSELAFYDDGERIINAVEEAVPLSGDIIAETSPNGENLVYDMWGKARAGRSSYKPLFFPWWVAGDYLLERGSEYALEADRYELVLAPEERDLMEKFGVTEDQLRWRRMKVADKGGLFYQEYPEDELNCFITVGEPVFDSYILDTLAKQCYPGKNHPTGAWIWKEAEKGKKYIIGADCSAGSVSYSAAAVLDEYYNVCATFMRKLDPTIFAQTLDTLGRYYNNAELAVERNAQGYAVLAVLEKYPNKYYQRDYTTGKQTSKVGWWTNEQTKSFMFSTFKDALPRLKVWDVNLVRQARGYRYVGLKPMPQTYDDLLIATMIAIAAKRTTSGSRGIIGHTKAWID